MTDLKRCTKCGRELPATTEYFHRGKGYRGGLTAQCKTCIDALRRQYESENREHVRARRAESNRKRTERLEANRTAPDVKQCSLCGVTKPATHEYFLARRDSADGFRGECRTCFNARQKRDYHANLDQHRTQNKRAAAAYRERNRETVYRKVREWKAANPAWARQYRANNRAQFNLYAHHRRTRRRGLPNTFTPADWQAALDAFGGCCAVCGRPAGLWHTLAMDHWIPLSSPNCPGTVPGNIVPLCHGTDGCNNSKGSNESVAWIKERLGARKGMVALRRIEAFLERVGQRG